MRKRCVAPYPSRPTRPLEHSHCRVKPTRTVRVHCEHILMWSECTGRTRRSGRSVYTGNPTRTVRERFARRVKLPVCTRPKCDTARQQLGRIHTGSGSVPDSSEPYASSRLSVGCAFTLQTTDPTRTVRVHFAVYTLGLLRDRL